MTQRTLRYLLIGEPVGALSRITGSKPDAPEVAALAYELLRARWVEVTYGKRCALVIPMRNQDWALPPPRRGHQRNFGKSRLFLLLRKLVECGMLHRKKGRPGFRGVAGRRSEYELADALRDLIDPCIAGHEVDVEELRPRGYVRLLGDELKCGDREEYRLPLLPTAIAAQRNLDAINRLAAGHMYSIDVDPDELQPTVQGNAQRSAKDTEGSENRAGNHSESSGQTSASNREGRLENLLNDSPQKLPLRLVLPETHFRADRLFHHDLRSYGRFHAQATSLAEWERRTLRIDGELCVEMDFHGSHINRLREELGLLPLTDVYDAPGLAGPEDRWWAKKAVLTLLNSKSYVEAQCSLEGVNRRYWQAVRAGRKPKRDEWPLPEGRTARAYLDAMIERHYEIAEAFCSNRALKFMFIESRIAEGILLDFVRHAANNPNDASPILSLHDGFVVPLRHAQLLLDSMRANWRLVVGTQHVPPVKVVAPRGTVRVMPDDCCVDLDTRLRAYS